MNDTIIGKNSKITKAIIAENVSVGDNVEMGIGQEAESKLDSRIYSGGLATIGEHTIIPSNVKIGKDVAISGITTAEDYPDGYLQSGEYIIKAGEV